MKERLIKLKLEIDIPDKIAPQLLEISDALGTAPGKLMLKSLNVLCHIYSIALDDGQLFVKNIDGTIEELVFNMNLGVSN